MPKVVARRAIKTLAKCSDAKVVLKLLGQHPIRKSDFLKRKHLIFPTIFCSLLIKYKLIILNANAVVMREVFCKIGNRFVHLQNISKRYMKVCVKKLMVWEVKINLNDLKRTRLLAM